MTSDTSRPDQPGDTNSDDSSIAGDGSGDPNSDREFLQDMPPAQVDDSADASDAEDDEPPYSEE